MPKKVHIMVDTEFVGSEPDAALVSIGAAVFEPDTGEVISKFYTRVDIEDCVRLGMSMDPSTVKWWVEQTHEVRRVMHAAGAPSLDKAMSDFQDYVRCSAIGNHCSLDNTFMWCHATVDIVKLRKSFETVGIDVPWKRRNVIDLWTLKSLAELVTSGTYVKPDFTSGTPHNALDDCIEQIKTSTELYNAIYIHDKRFPT